MATRLSELSDWISRQMVQSVEQAELNNLCAALLTVEGAGDRLIALTALKDWFDEHPELLGKRSENLKFYQDFLAPLTAEENTPAGLSRRSLALDPIAWRMMARMARELMA